MKYIELTEAEATRLEEILRYEIEDLEREFIDEGLDDDYVIEQLNLAKAMYSKLQK
jgi:hypothetical protein